jgi:hypothetical protein
MPVNTPESAEVRVLRRDLLVALIALFVLLALARDARAQSMRELVDNALDQKVTRKIEIKDLPFAEALAALEKPTGLTFEIDSRAIDWMPFGENTRLSITIDDISAREGLARIFDGLGLAMRVSDKGVVVEPSPLLMRMGRRLTTDEVGLLQKLALEPWTKLAGPQLRVEFRLPPEDKNAERFDRALREASEPSALRQLDAATQRFGWVWTLDGGAIVVYGQGEDIQRRLDQLIDVTYRRTALEDLLLDLGKRTGLTIRFEPGVLARIAARDRKVDLIQRGTTVRQVLELLSGNTGLAYSVTPAGIMIGMPRVGDAPAALDGARVVAIVHIPVGNDGTTVDFLIRADELPPELRALREKRMPQIIELLKRELDKP